MIRRWIPVLCVLVAIAGLTALPLRATELFFDDFEGYIDDLELQDVGGWLVVEVNTPNETGAAWTVTNPGGRGHPAGIDGLPSDGQFLISDSDHSDSEDIPGTGMSHDIWSPEFNCASATKVWLHMDTVLQMNNNGLCVFDVDVTTDGGTTWTNVYRRVAPSRAAPLVPAVTTKNSDGYLGLLDVDFSAVAANKPKVQFRLRQFEPSDDWWFAVDNVVVDDQPPPQGGSTVLVCEQFDGGIPESWQVVSNVDPPNEGALTWSSIDPCARSVARTGKPLPYLGGRGLHRLDEGFALVDSDCDPDATPTPEDDYLITPTVDCTAATGVFLHFKDEILLNAGATEQVLLSLDGGITFELNPVFSYSLGAGFAGGEDPFYQERVIPVPAAVGRNKVAFAFQYTSGGNAGFWAVDDVKVSITGNAPPTRTCCTREFEVGEFNAQAGSVSMKWNPLAGDEGFRIIANGGQVGADLPASATSFTDTAPPGGSACVTYSLQSLKGGAVEFTCDGACVPVVACPTGFSCCVDQGTRVVTLRWRQGANISGTGWRILRDGIPIKTLPLTADTYQDTAPGTGEFEYQLVLNGGNAAQCPDLPLTCKAVVSGGDFIFFDDFDCYESDAQLAAKGWQVHEVNTPSENCNWTIQDRGGRGPPPNRSGQPTQGKYIVSDSDAAAGGDTPGSGMSHDIWSPTFSCTGKATVWLHMDATIVLNNNGEAVFDVDVSVDNGASWENVFRRVAPARKEAEPFPLADIPEELPGGPQVGNADAFYGPLDLDISGLAGNKASVRVRLRQFEPNDDWWMEVDNFLVDTNPLPQGSQTIFAREGFDSDIPTTWTVQSGDGVATWTAADICNVSLLHSNGGTFPDAADGRQLHHMDQGFAMVFMDETCAITPGEESLLTPVIDCSGRTKVYLHFKSGILPTDAIAEVLLSVDGGTTFDTANPVFSYSTQAAMLRDAGNAEATYNEYILEVPAAAGQAKVVFSFHYNNVAKQAAYWAIDDVMVTGEGGIVAKTFHRGDADDNGSLELTDAIRVLNFLFLGGAAPTCFDAADADDNGELQLTDAIRILGYLFLGGPAPAPPGPPPEACGPDPTASIGCESYTHC